ncbi:unnamed protein product [Darwinula stevensoni]|uniref:Cullin-2 n=1 Tax=Darwinula stevensoni TaxID=69355 RepID=A0A7R9FRY0_9CRUS|nr:unnamed protein product [Darwinula stevensoni]CAG0902644.1 unnamed protein product [Darwinula stevensoni]
MSLKPRPMNFDDTWPLIKDTLLGVITLRKIPKAVWNDRFSDVYALCVAQPDPLGDRLYQEIKKSLEKHVDKIFEGVSKTQEENLLLNYHSQWLEYSIGTSYLNNLFTYLNSQHIRKQKPTDADLVYGDSDIETQEQMLEIGELALSIWRRGMILPLKDTLVKLLLEGIHNDRLGASPNVTVVHGVIQSLVQVENYKRKTPLHLYETIFEGSLLKETGEYYQQEAQRLLENSSTSEYMEKVISKMDEECLRARKFLNPSSYQKVVGECEQRMVADHLELLSSESKDMVSLENLKDLQNLYLLLKSIPSGLGVLASRIQDHIKAKGLESIHGLSGDNIPNLFVDNLLQIHSKYSQMVQSIFLGDHLFLSALDKACAAVINYRPTPKQPCHSAELLARYCDMLLKKSSKSMSESEVDEKLARAIIIFRYIDDKDVFQKFYAKMLSRRLIHQLSMSMDAEEAMINRLKEACGYEFTNKLHRMFTDMSISSDLNQKFSAYVKKGNVDLGITFSIYVLQTGAWPFSNMNLSPFALPQELEKSVQHFETFYHSNFTGRKLTWMHHLCNGLLPLYIFFFLEYVLNLFGQDDNYPPCWTGELKLNHLKKPYYVTLGTYQMAILLLFSTCDSYKVHELQRHTHLNEDQFGKHFASLVDAKLFLVSPSSTQEKEVKESVVTLNMNYSNKKTKFKIAFASQKETQQEVEQTHSSVDEDRKVYIQAAIVRIMKSRKILKHNELIQEVLTLSQGRFTPSIPLIKKCIESLIDKQYLERTPNSTDEYGYIA